MNQRASETGVLQGPVAQSFAVLTFRTNDQEGDFTAADILGMVCNPIYAGVGPFPQLISDEEWVAAASQAIKKEGEEQFLVNMLYLLRLSLAGEME